MEKIIIAAMAANRVIGRDSSIPWHIPGEQKRFQRTTWGHALIMGRKTHESIGRPLPGRRNIIITRNPHFRAPGCEIAHSLPEAYTLCRNEQKVFNIGGEEIYRQGLSLADTLILTVLARSYDGNIHFPDFSEKIFILVAAESYDLHDISYSVRTYRRTAA